MIGATKQKWLLILDNADDPAIDYKTYIPPGSSGAIVITSRMRDCALYSTVGSIYLDCLTRAELIELFLKSSRTPKILSSSLSKRIEDVIDAVESHTLAVIQAGAFIAAGGCKLDQYSHLFQKQRRKIFQYTQQQAKPRWGSIASTFEAGIAGLEKRKNGADALSMLNVLSMLHFSPVPIQIFEDAYRGSVAIREPEPSQISSSSLSLSQWYPHLPEFLVTVEGAKASIRTEWDQFRLTEAIHLLESLALLIRSDSAVSMHPLVYAWAKDRQSSSQQGQSWMAAGSVIALSNHGSSLWHLNQSKLRSHLQAFLDTDIVTTFSYGPEPIVLEILFQCGRILLQMRDDDKLTELLNSVLSQLKTNHENSSPALLAFSRLSAADLFNRGKYEEAELLGRRMLAEEERLGPEHPSMFTTMNDLAVILNYQGQHEEAEALLRRALAGTEASLGPSHPRTLPIVCDLASILLCQGKYEEADVMNRRALAGRETLLGANHPDTLESMANLASAYGVQARWMEAQELQIAVLGKRKQVLGQDHPDTLTSIATLASIYRNQGRLEDAEQLQVDVF